LQLQLQLELQCQLITRGDNTNQPSSQAAGELASQPASMCAHSELGHKRPLHLILANWLWLKFLAGGGIYAGGSAPQ